MVKIMNQLWALMGLILLIKLQFVSAITGFDCSGKTILTKTYSTIDTEICSPNKRNITSKNISIQLIQPKDIEEIPYKRCSVIAMHHIFRCGKSIDSNHDAGFYSETIKIDYDECNKMIETKRYKFPITNGMFEVELELNEIKTVAFTSVGTITHDTTCYPVDSFNANGRTYNRAIRQTNLRIIISKEIGRLNVDEKTLNIANGNKFNFFSNQGFSADFGFIFWDSSFKHHSCVNEDKNFQVLYQGSAVKVTEYSDLSVSVSYMFTINSEYTTQIFINENVVDYASLNEKLNKIEACQGQVDEFTVSSRHDHPMIDFITSYDFPPNSYLAIIDHDYLIATLRVTADPLSMEYFLDAKCPKTKFRIIEDLVSENMERQLQHSRVLNPAGKEDMIARKGDLGVKVTDSYKIDIMYKQMKAIDELRRSIDALSRSNERLVSQGLSKPTLQEPIALKAPVTAFTTAVSTDSQGQKVVYSVPKVFKF